MRMRPKPRQIVIYCPDRHIVYDGRTPDHTGIGGGITARVRLASALARRGHAVTVVCNCRERCTSQGVRYHRLDEVRRLEADVLILNTTRGAPDLRPALGLDIPACFRMAWVGGVPEPLGIHEVPFDVLCAPSNFIRGVARDAWGIPPSRLAVFPNGVERRLFRRLWWRRYA